MPRTTYFPAKRLHRALTELDLTSDGTEKGLILDLVHISRDQDPAVAEKDTNH